MRGSVIVRSPEFLSGSPAELAGVRSSYSAAGRVFRENRQMRGILPDWFAVVFRRFADLIMGWLKKGGTAAFEVVGRCALSVMF